MTEFWGDSQESYGPVTTDRIQTVFLTDTQSVTEVKVKEGDTVKKGDILMSFDTTLSDLQLERKRLEVEKEKLQLEALNAELTKIKNMTPMTPMEDIGWGMDIPDISQGAEMTAPFEVYMGDEYDGKSMGTAFICRLRSDTAIDNDLLEELRQRVWLDQGLCEHGNWAETCIECDPPLCRHNFLPEECPICSLDFCPYHDGYLAGFCPVCHESHGDPSATANSCIFCSEGLCKHFRLWAECEECNPPPDPPVSEEEESEDQALEGLSFASDGNYEIRFLSNDAPSDGASWRSYYVIFKITEGNMDLSATTFWQGVYVSRHGDHFSLSLFTPMTEDYTLPKEEEGETEIETPGIDFGSGYTAAEIAKMRKEQEKKIKEQDLKTKMADAEYKIMQRELNDGNIYADFDGKVVSLLTEDEARAQEQPVVKVSGGGGFYITGSVSELEKDNLLIGQEVTVNDWRNGGNYTGRVESIGDFPSSTDSWNGMGNPTATYYPFTAFVGEEANLQSGSYVSVQYSTSGSSNGIYLNKPFVRTEKGVSFVYVQGEDGRLEKRIVTTGKSLWGSYLEVLDGVTAQDKLAFPYGKDVKEGAKTAEGDISNLYGY